ncbi:sensor histidine kinase N-terminal domain-containing protein [Orrella sp. JC864]|uniref:sensor histidine kinase n=1 Tax=Orrella sp. JC864 TaxID=3120298 RepID=UPI00300A92C0
MLAPLFLLWPMSVAITYVVAQNIANVPYDRALSNYLHVLADQVQVRDGQAALELSAPARRLLRTDQADSVFWMVTGSHGQYLGGDRELPLPPPGTPAVPGQISYRDDTLRDFGIRLAYTWLPAASTQAQPALLVVAETLERREQLANDIIKGVIIPQFVVLPIAVLLVWFGLSRGVAPLNALRQRLRERRPDDLSPLDENAAPTEIAPLVEAVNELLGRLSASVQAQRRFVADAAHQLKTPLAGLRTQAELALHNASPEDMQSSLRQLVAGSEHATRLVNQLLLLAKAENAGGVSMERLDLDALAREQTQYWVPQAMATGIDLGFEAPDGPLWVFGNPLLLAELLNNLLDNALRYTPQGGHVTVRLAHQRMHAVLEVIDTGPGIPPQERERVFDRFYRVLGTGVSGSGLGLAIVREIAQKHQGQVVVDAATPAGQGTCVRLTLLRLAD